MTAALRPPAIGRVTNHAITIFLNNFQSTPSRDRNHPTNTILPTLQCVVEIGTPIFEATRTVAADPTSMEKPLKTKLCTTPIIHYQTTNFRLLKIERVCRRQFQI